MKWEEPVVIQHGSCKIVIHRPVLSKSDRAKREDQIKASLESVMRSYIRRKEQSNDNKNTSGVIREKQIQNQ